MVPLVIAVVLYTVVSLAVRHPSPTPLDFRAVTAPAYLLLHVAVAVLVLVILAPLSTLNATALAWGYAGASPLWACRTSSGSRAESASSSSR
ncbi:MAG: hypothetical protein DME14_08570 [Candidatus Rokuibacteriota bacterium]|nr:MAG: hypothetical protein DME14_08570 [Candidatus Rokubacteria bacterium]